MNPFATSMLLRRRRNIVPCSYTHCFIASLGNSFEQKYINQLEPSEFWIWKCGCVGRFAKIFKNDGSLQWYSYKWKHMHHYSQTLKPKSVVKLPATTCRDNWDVKWALLFAFCDFPSLFANIFCACIKSFESLPARSFPESKSV